MDLPGAAWIKDARPLMRRWPLFLSGLLHLALIGKFVSQAPTSTLPLGHWVEMLPQGALAPSQAVSRKVHPDASLPTEKAEQTPAAETAAPLGNTAQSTGLSGPAGDMAGVQVSLRARYLYELEVFLNQHKVYPPRARHLGMSGRVEVAFHLAGDGTITDPHVVRPCIHDLLNRAAVDLVASVGRFRPIPAELQLSVLHVTVPIQYELN